MAKRAGITGNGEGGPDHVHCACVAGLEADVAFLKKQLAAKAGRTAPVTTTDTGDDWMNNLSPQDRQHMRRKMGGSKR